MFTARHWVLVTTCAPARERPIKTESLVLTSASFWSEWQRCEKASKLLSVLWNLSSLSRFTASPMHAVLKMLHYSSMCNWASVKYIFYRQFNHASVIKMLQRSSNCNSLGYRWPLNIDICNINKTFDVDRCMTDRCQWLLLYLMYFIYDTITVAPLSSSGTMELIASLLRSVQIINVEFMSIG